MKPLDERIAAGSNLRPVSDWNRPAAAAALRFQKMLETGEAFEQPPETPEPPRPDSRDV